MAQQSVLILREADKFILFEYPNDTIDLPREPILDEADSGSSILALARHVVSKISSGFKISYLTVDNPNEVSISTASLTSEKHDLVNSNNLLDIWQSANYNIWADELCNLDYFIENQKQLQNEKSDNHENTINSPQIFYFIHEIKNIQAFTSKMQSLSVKIHLLSLPEIINSTKISSATKDLFSNQLRINTILSPMKYTLNVILILNSLHNGEAMVKQVLDGIPRMPTSALYHGVFRQNGQKWITYNSTNLSKDLPSDEELKLTHVIVMPGSSASSYLDNPWILRYKKWIQNAYHNHNHLKFLGICFGEQIFAEALGGKCDKVKERKLDPHYYNYKVDPIQFTAEFYNLPYVKLLKLKNQTYYLSKAHGDIVEELDEKAFQVFGSSNKYRIEIFGDNSTQQNHNVSRVLCIQGHPEYVGKWILNKNSQFYSKFSKKPLQECIAQAYQDYISNPPDTFDVFRDICKSFMTYDN